MYAGHAAVALALRWREPRLPIVPLTLACYGPDCIEVALLMINPQARMALFTHSIPAVMISAALVTLLWKVMRKPGAWVLGVAWLLHWPADLFTGRKPLIFSTPTIGLDLYQLPLADFALEATVVAIGCAIYARGVPRRAEFRRVIVILGAALIALQGAVDVALGVMRNTEWEPSLASATRQSHLPRPRVHGWAGLRMRFAFSPLTQPTRGRDGNGRTPGHRDAGLPHLRQGEVLHQRGAGGGELRAVRQHRLPDLRHTDRARRGGDRRARGAGTEHGVRG